MRVDVQVLGLKHLTEVLTRTIPAEARQGVIVGALKEAAKPIITTAKQGYRALDGSGSLDTLAEDLDIEQGLVAYLRAHSTVGLIFRNATSPQSYRIYSEFLPEQPDYPALRYARVS